MNRIEALRILGLDEDATPEDIKVAYKETAQILHPDRFQGNKKLQDRATEQFKNLQEAYNYLTKGQGSKGSGTRGGGTASRTSGSSSSSGTAYYSTDRTEARLAGIAAARAQLVAQRDTLLDERRNAIAMAVIGGIVALVSSRRTVGILAAVFGIASAAAVWGVVQAVSTNRTITTLEEHIEELNEEEARLKKKKSGKKGKRRAQDEKIEDKDEVEGE